MLKYAVIAVVVSLCATAAPVFAADEARYELKAGAVTIKDILSEQAGKRVVCRLGSGENLEGTVIRVGESVVHLARVAGRDYYDAVIRIDRIDAVLLKVRGPN